MAIRAERDPRYYLRFVIIGWAAIAFALWALYDGAVKYPQQRERGLAYQEMEEEGRAKEWDQYAIERGWPTEYPGEPKTDADIKMQFVMVGIAGSIGLLTLLNVWRSRGRWIELGANGLSSSWGETVPFNRILSLDKKSWKSKGIARVKYEDGNRKRRFVIDDYKFKREPTDQILYDLEERIEPDKIVGGPPEPLRQSPEEIAAAASAGEVSKN